MCINWQPQRTLLAVLAAGLVLAANPLRAGFPVPPPVLNPKTYGLIMDAANDRIVVRIADPDINRNAASWRAYRDGLWLERPESASVAPDGSIAVVSRGMSGIDKIGIAVSIYSSVGEPIRTFTLPGTVEWYSPEIAYDGKRLVVAERKTIVLLEPSGKALGQLTPPGEPDALWTPFLSSGGDQLLLFDGVKTLQRYELP